MSAGRDDGFGHGHQGREAEASGHAAEGKAPQGLDGARDRAQDHNRTKTETRTRDRERTEDGVRTETEAETEMEQGEAETHRAEVETEHHELAASR